MKSKAVAFGAVFLICSLGRVGQADTYQLDVASDRCTIAFALTGKVLAGCSAPSLQHQITRSLSGADGGYFVNFEFNSNAISTDATQHLTRLSKLLTGPLAHLCVKLVGHTDTKGSMSYNKGLSEKRAQAVRLFMVGVGNIQTTRLKSEGAGEERPLPGIAGSDGKNRRVEILAKDNGTDPCT